MGTVVQFDQRREPDLCVQRPRVWLAGNKKMTFQGVHGELVATLRFVDVRGELYACLITRAGFVYHKAACGQDLFLHEAGVEIGVLAIERGDVTRVLMEFRP